VIKIKSIYEVESRFQFKDEEEIFVKLPFVKNSLKTDLKWESIHYGPRLFKEDIVLRMSTVDYANSKMQSISYKEADLGEKINVRREYSEIINEELLQSKIINILGGNRAVNSWSGITEELLELGHKNFMSFRGQSRVGHYGPLNLDIKIMYCSALRYPLLLELEKAASDIEDAKVKSRELWELIEEYELKDKMIIKEPPTLLYETIY